MRSYLGSATQLFVVQNWFTELHQQTVFGPTASSSLM